MPTRLNYKLPGPRPDNEARPIFRILAGILGASGLFSTTALVYAAVVERAWVLVPATGLTLPFTFAWLLVAVNGRIGFQPGRKMRRPPNSEWLDP